MFMQEDNIRLDAEGKLADVLLNEPTIIEIGGNTYEIRAFTPYISWMISSRINKMLKAEATAEGMIAVLANNIPVLAEVIAIAIINDDKERLAKDLDALKYDLLNSRDYYKWLDYVKIIFEKLDFSFFFLITRQIEQLSTIAKKMTKKELESLIQKQN